MPWVRLGTARRSARPSRDDKERSALTLKPCAAAYAAAVSPLARHAATRDRHIAVLSDIDEQGAAPKRSYQTGLMQRLQFFATDAVGPLHVATARAIRDLDRLVAAALRETAKKRRKIVERDVVARDIESDNGEF